MKCLVQQIDNNARYRILNINNEQYILDLEQSVWKILFPFFFWIFPCNVYKIEDPVVVNQLKSLERDKTKGSILFLGGISYFLGILLAPLMDYFNISITPVVSTILLLLLLIIVFSFYLFTRNKRKTKLYNVIALESLKQDKLWIRPNSFKHVIKLAAAYLFLLAFVLLGVGLHFKTGNLMALVIGAGLWFGLLFAIRATVQEGHTTVKFKK